MLLYSSVRSSNQLQRYCLKIYTKKILCNWFCNFVSIRRFISFPSAKRLRIYKNLERLLSLQRLEFQLFSIRFSISFCYFSCSVHFFPVWHLIDTLSIFINKIIKFCLSHFNSSLVGRFFGCFFFGKTWRFGDACVLHQQKDVSDTWLTNIITVDTRFNIFCEF